MQVLCLFFTFVLLFKTGYKHYRTLNVVYFSETIIIMHVSIIFF